MQTTPCHIAACNKSHEPPSCRSSKSEQFFRLVSNILKEETPSSYAQMGSNTDDASHQQKLSSDSSLGSSALRHLDSLEQTRTLVNRLNLVDEAHSMMSDDEKWIIQTMETPSENLIFPNIDDDFNCRQTIF